MIKERLSGMVTAVGVVLLPAMTFAAAPATFDMGLATSTMDIAWDLFADVINTLIPYVLPIIASAGVLFALYRLGKRFIFGGIRS